MITQITDYAVFNAPPYLLEQFRATEVETLAAIPDKQFNELEAAAFALFASMWIDGGSGVQLDAIGAVVGLNRDGRDDANYKTLLKLKAIINNTTGTAEAIISAVRQLYLAQTIYYIPVPPAKIQIFQDGLVGLYLYYLAELVGGDILVDDTGTDLYFSEEDNVSENLLYSLLPVGVGLLTAYYLTVDAGDDQLITDDNYYIQVVEM